MRRETIAMEGLEVALTVDAKGLGCPLPVLRAKKGIESIAVGEVLQVLSTDPGSMADFQAWTRTTGHELLAAEERDGIYTYHIRRLK
jgi:tRNA 2-thiouridine synthesizing protein A